MIVRSPKHGIVVALHVADGSAVARGDILASIDSDGEELTLARVAAVQSIVKRYQFKVSRTFIEAARNELLAALHIAESAAQSADRLYKITKTKHELGAITEEPLIERMHSLQEAKMNLVIAKSKLDQFDMNTAAQRKMYKSLVSHIRTELEFGERSRKKVAVRAPADGRIKFDVGVDSAVKRGQTIGVLS